MPASSTLQVCLCARHLFKRQRVVETCMTWRVFTAAAQPCSFGSNAATGTHSISVLFGISGRKYHPLGVVLLSSFPPFSSVPATHTRASFVTPTAGFRTFGICVCTRVGTVPYFARHKQNIQPRELPSPHSEPSVPQRHHLIIVPAPRPTALDCIIVHTQYTLI